MRGDELVAKGMAAARDRSDPGLRRWADEKQLQAGGAVARRRWIT